MITLSNVEIWTIIAALACGTYLIRYSFLGLIGDRPMPEWVLRLLRYTPVAVIPGMVAPLAIWPDATGGNPDPARLAAGFAALAVGYWTKNTLYAILSGAVVLYAGLGLGALV